MRTASLRFSTNSGTKKWDRKRTLHARISGSQIRTLSKKLEMATKWVLQKYRIETNIEQLLFCTIVIKNKKFHFRTQFLTYISIPFWFLQIFSSLIHLITFPHILCILILSYDSQTFSTIAINRNPHWYIITDLVSVVSI